MQSTKHIIAAVAGALALGATGLAQEPAQDRGRNNPVDALVESLSLTDEQVDEIRDIRRERPPRDQNRDERAAWRDEQQEKVRDVLTDDQEAQVAEIEEAREKMQMFAGAAILGLTDVPFGNRGFQANRSRAPQGGSGSRFRGRQGGSRGGGRFSPQRRGGQPPRRGDSRGERRGRR